MTRRIVTPGLAPSMSLAPSLTLAPQDTIYAGGPITPHRFAMAVGTNGAYVDISAWVEYGQGVTRTYGRETQFDDISPGSFTFTLNNLDGRFTPENVYSPWATKVAEGMGVVWQLGTRLVAGKVLSIDIPADEDSWDQIVITCDDMLGTAGRHSLTSIVDDMLTHQGQQLLWRLDEDPEATAGVEANGDGLGAFTLHSSNPASTTEAVTFGVEQAPWLPGTAVTVTAAPGETNWFGTKYANTAQVSALTSPALTSGSNGAPGFWNFWVYPGSTINFAVTPAFANGPGYSYSMQVQVTQSTISLKPGTAAPFVYTMSSAQQLTPHYVEMPVQMIWQASGSYWALFTFLYVDGVAVGSKPWFDPVNQYHVPGTAGSLAPVVVNVSVTNPSGATGNLSGTVQRISYTAPGGGLEHRAKATTLDGRRAVLDTLADDLLTAVYQGPLTTAPIGYVDVGGSTVLDVLNDIARTESGHLVVGTSGTLTTPLEAVYVRARDRPSVPEARFDVTAELEGPPQFIRDLTNLAASTEVAGPSNTVTVRDSTVTGRYITAGASETVLYAADQDLREWGQDRLYRGRNRAIRTQQFTINTVTTPIDRSADILALLPGDRVQLTNLPAARLGFSTWDGWVLGGSEAHTVDGNRFTFTLAPTIPNGAIADTDRFADDNDILLGNTYTASATSMVFNGVGTERDPVLN
jgi:hypothetical protein